MVLAGLDPTGMCVASDGTIVVSTLTEVIELPFSLMALCALSSSLCMCRLC